MDGPVSMGGGLAIFGVVPLALLVIGSWAVVRVLHKAGRSGWWVLLAFLHPVNLIVVWLFAYARWPNVDPAPQALGRGHGEGSLGPGPGGEPRAAAERLEELERLYREGRITPEEYAERRKTILDSL